MAPRATRVLSWVFAALSAYLVATCVASARPGNVGLRLFDVLYDQGVFVSAFMSGVFWSLVSVAGASAALLLGPGIAAVAFGLLAWGLWRGSAFARHVALLLLGAWALGSLVYAVAALAGAGHGHPALGKNLAAAVASTGLLVWTIRES